MADRYPYSNSNNSWSRPHQLASTSRLPPPSSATSTRSLRLPEDHQPNDTSDLSLPRRRPNQPPTIAATRPLPTGPQSAIPARLKPAGSPLFIPKRQNSNWGKVGRWSDSSSGDTKGKGKTTGGYDGGGANASVGGATRVWGSNAGASTSAAPATPLPPAATLAACSETTEGIRSRLPQLSEWRAGESSQETGGSVKGKEPDDGSSRGEGSQPPVASPSTPLGGTPLLATPIANAFRLPAPRSTPLPPSTPLSRPVPTPISTPGDSDSLTLYVGNLPLSITEAKIDTLFKPFGRIVDVSLGSSPLLSHDPSGPPPVPSFRAFVKFATDREARAAVSMDGRFFEGSHLHVAVNLSPRSTHSKPTAESVLPNRLYVGKLPKDILSPTLRTAFSTYGTVLAIEIKQRTTNAFAFVRFSSPAEADAALALDGSTIFSGTSPISVVPARPNPVAAAPPAASLFHAPSASPAPSSQAFKRDSEAPSLGEERISVPPSSRPQSQQLASNHQLAASTSRLSREPQRRQSEDPKVPLGVAGKRGSYRWESRYPARLVASGKAWRTKHVAERTLFRTECAERVQALGGTAVHFMDGKKQVIVTYRLPHAQPAPVVPSSPPVLFYAGRILAFKNVKTKPTGVFYCYVAPQLQPSTTKKDALASIRDEVRRQVPGFKADKVWLTDELSISLRAVALDRPVEVAPGEPEEVEDDPMSVSDDGESLLIQRVAEREESVEEAWEDVAKDDGRFVDRIDVPESCRGSSASAAKGRQSFLVKELRKAYAEGKIVLSNSFEGDDFGTLVLDYIVALPEDDGPEQDEQPVARPAPARSPPAVQHEPELDVEMEDVKPSLAPPENMDEDEIDQLESPSPEPPALPPSLPFPLGLAGSFADSPETKKQVDLFITEYFAKFDSERGGLDAFYTKSALFSVRVVNAPPRRLRQPPSPFLKRYVEAAKALSITPTPITNAIRKLPAASHDLSKIRYDAFEVPPPPHKKGRKSLLLNIYGELEEFPSHEVRSFTRTFLLVPKIASLGGAGSPLDYLISSDQITFRHRDVAAPHPIAIAVPPPIQAPNPNPPAQRPPPPPAQQLDRLPAKQLLPPASRPLPPPPQQRQAALPPPPKPAPKPVEKRRLPVEHSSSNSDDDVIILAQPPPKRRDLRPSPQPHAVASPALSAKAAGKRRAVSPAPAPRRAPIIPRQAPAVVRDRSASPDSEDDEVSPAEAAASEARRRERQATVGLDFGLSRKDVEAMVAKEVAKALARKEAAPARKERNVPAPPVARALAPLPSDDDGDEPSDGRVFIPGASSSVSHGYTGVTNKMRHLVDTEDSLFGMTLAGDIVEWDRSSKAGSVQQIYKSKRAADKVDAFEYSTAKDTLVVGYLGGVKVTGEKGIPKPPSQITLFKRETTSRGHSKLTPDPLPELPHLSGGVSALTLLPGSRLTFATGGQDKMLFLWTRRRTTQTMEVTSIASEHSAIINSLAHIRGKKWLVSGGADKRILGYDLGHQKIVWRKVLPSSVSVVQEVPSDPNLFLCRLQSTSDQFHLFDLRIPSTRPAALHFGFALPPTTSSTTSALVDRTLSRYLLGSFSNSLYATPDSESGIKIYDIRRTKGEGAVVQSWAGAGRSRVVQTLFQGPNSLALAELHNFTMLKLA